MSFKIKKWNCIYLTYTKSRLFGKFICPHWFFETVIVKFVVFVHSFSFCLVLHHLPEFVKLMCIKSVMLSNHLVLCHLLLLPSVFASIRVFSNELALCIIWSKYWRFNFNISPSNEYSELISFRIDWLDLLAVQGTLKGLLQHHNSKVSILWHSAFFMFQLSHPYTTTGKTIALSRCTFVSKVMCLLFNTLSRFLTAFLWSSKLKVSFNFMAAVTICSDFGAQENKVSVYIVKYDSSNFPEIILMAGNGIGISII